MMRLIGPPNVDRLEKQRNVKGLLEALGYTKKKDADDWKIRQGAAEAFGRIRALEARDPLSRADGDWSPAARLAAVQALTNLDPHGYFTRANAHELLRACFVSQIPGALDYVSELGPYLEADRSGAASLPFIFSRGPLAIILGALVEVYINSTSSVQGLYFSKCPDRALAIYISDRAGKV